MECAIKLIDHCNFGMLQNEAKIGDEHNVLKKHPMLKSCN